MRVGMAVYVLPLANPLRVAEEAATLDHVSGGRFDFGIGRSGFITSYNSYGVDYDESQARFDESLAIIRRAWQGEKFSYEGQFYQVHDALVVPQPLQQPHPPIRMAATSPGTFEKVAKEGLPIFVGLRGDGLDQLREGLGIYRRVWRESGHEGAGSVYLRVPVYAAETERAAYEEPRDCIIYYFERQAKLVARAGARKGVGTGGAKATAARLAALSYDDILKNRVAFGSPSQLIERLKEWREVLDIDGIVAELNAGGMLTEEQVRNSLRVLTRDVMPAFK